jgi:uncharacterized membrane protein YidH (DUF202 family)
VTDEENKKPVRPARLPETPVPPIPTVEDSQPGASLQYSRYQTNLSNHRTALSEHRTSLSEYRTDLSTHRTDLSTHRTDLSANRSEMSMRRTGMSFQRTRMSADRTLMSVIRTSLSLIGFGFTIYQGFEKLRESGVIASAHAPRNFGMTLVALGIGMLVFGIGYHLRFMYGLRQVRAKMAADGLVHADSGFPPSLTLITALVPLAIGIVAIISMIFRIGPF